MKLKNLLFYAFLGLTLFPIAIVVILLYNSGLNLSKESYIRNLTESINVQSDYISQTLENNMINDYRFASRTLLSLFDTNKSPQQRKDYIYDAYQAYLETAEDKIAASLLLDSSNTLIYSTGEKAVLDIIKTQLPLFTSLSQQTIVEFNLGNGIYSLGLVTLIRDNSGNYRGSLVSVYEKFYIYKIISSYYELSDTTAYICRGDGSIVNFRGAVNDKVSMAVETALREMSLGQQGNISLSDKDISASGYYKNIRNSPWYLIGLISYKQIFAFANQFILFYILLIIIVFIVALLLSFYVSKRVVRPINHLIQVMQDYPASLKDNDTLEKITQDGYSETRYLWSQFLSLMKKIMLVQHNFEGVYKLYHSSAMDDTNIDIDVMAQTIHSNKTAFDILMRNLIIPEGACIVERFTRCFCDKDQRLLMKMFEEMRDEHLSVTREGEFFTPHLGSKWFHILVVPMYEAERLSRLFVQLRDISSFKKNELESLEQARRDPLTKIYNRSGFEDNVNRILKESGEIEFHGLLFIDMDNFKMVNDNCGHAKGDELLCAVSNKLTETIGSSGLVSRFGGDEFAVFLPNTRDVQAFADKLTSVLVYPYQTEEKFFVISASIGVAIWQHGMTLENLLENADTAMYEVKKQMKQGRRKSDNVVFNMKRK